MNEHAVRTFLAERIPDWEDALIRYAGDSRGGARFFLTLGGERAMLKIDTVERPVGCNDRVTESQLQTAAAEEGLAPSVLYADEQAILTEYLDGDALDANRLAEPACLRRLGSQLKSLHALPPTGRRFDALAAARVYARRLPQSALRERCVGIIAALEPFGPEVFSHNDLVAGNLLDDGSLRFIDFEYAADNSALFDVATLIAHHGLPSAAIEVLIDARFGDSADRELREALSDHIHAYHALNWLWLASHDGEALALERIVAELDA